MTKLEIPNNIFVRMVRQAKGEAPIEACGILAGKDGRVEKFYEMTNADQSHNHFTMVPEEQFKVIKDIRGTELEMLAIYHSHPATPARLSEEDIRMAFTPNTIYVILSLQGVEPVAKGFVIEDDSVTEVEVKIKAEQE